MRTDESESFVGRSRIDSIYMEGFIFGIIPTPIQSDRSTESKLNFCPIPTSIKGLWLARNIGHF